MPSWARIVNTTTRKYFKGEEINILRNRKFLALMQSRGRVTYNHSGESMDWKVRYRRSPLVGYADGDTLTFARTNKWKTANLDWRGYTVQDSMTKFETLQNRSTEAIVKLYDNVMKILKDDIDDQFGDEFYVDGNAAGNSKRIHGFESCLTATEDADEGAGTAGDTYAGLVTTLGNYGGTWTGTWPAGSGDSHYDFWTPLVVNVTSTFAGFPTSTNTFAAQGDECIRWGIINCQKNKSKRGMLDLILLDRTYYMNFLELIDTKERFLSRPGRNEGSLAKLGFTDSVNWDGVDISWEYGIPTASGYGVNVDSMELRSMQSQLFVPTGPDYDVASKSYRFDVDFLGNLVMNPRDMMKLEELT
jgi:hypothetical protein